VFFVIENRLMTDYPVPSVNVFLNGTGLIDAFIVMHCGGLVFLMNEICAATTMLFIILNRFLNVFNIAETTKTCLS